MSDDIPSTGPGGPIEPDLTPSCEDANQAGAASSAPPRPKMTFGMFLERLVYALGFGIVAWVLFWLIALLLAPMQFIHLAITGRTNPELKNLSLKGIHYMVELLAFVTVARDDKPFPFGPFPQL